MKVLFDTNVLFAAFVSKGFCEEVLEQAAGDCALVWSEPLQKELLEVLERKGLAGPPVRAAIEAYAGLCEFCKPGPISPPACRDPDDDVVLATAAAGDADVIVTGDEDLLVLKRHGRIRILSPRQFVERRGKT